MSSKDWQVGPVLKAKLNSQGTLFRGGTKYSSDKRYPRGYTPERLVEVRPNIGNSSNFRDYPFGTDHPIGKGTGEGRRRVVDAVARSTVPVAHLQGVQFVPGQATLRAGQHKDDLTQVSGLYHSGAPHLRNLLTSGGYGPAEEHMLRNGPTIQAKDKARISIRAGEEDTPTTIHEIGHHVSSVKGTPHSAYDTVEKRGTEEAFADEYAHEHYRDHQGNPQTDKRVYASGFRGGNRTDEFYEAYHAHRGTEDRNWDSPTPYQLRRERQQAEDNASSLFHMEPERPYSFVHQPRVNPDALPEGRTPEDVNPVRKTSNWHDRYRW